MSSGPAQCPASEYPPRLLHEPVEMQVPLAPLLTLQVGVLLAVLVGFVGGLLLVGLGATLVGLPERSRGRQMGATSKRGRVCRFEFRQLELRQ